LKSLVLPDNLRSRLKEPLGKLYRCNGIECVRAMEAELRKASKVIAVGDVTAYYLLEASVMPDLLIVDHKTKRASTPEHVKSCVKCDDYKTVEVVNPAASLTPELIALIKDSLQSESKTRIVVDGEEDLATLPVILYAPEGAAVVYGQPNEGSVLVIVTESKREEIRSLMDRMISED
jgi:GTP-dependent dephospho-CoA kinase